MWRCWDLVDYRVACFANDDGVLLGGDSLSNNVFELFSGFDDYGSEIDNYWESHLTDHDIERLKKTKKFPIQGHISKDQSFDIYFSYDNDAYVYIGSIHGTGSYVDLGQAVTIGSLTIGKKEVGGGSDDVTVYKYKKEFRVNTDKYQEIKVKFIAREIGFVSISKYSFKDIRIKRSRLPAKYRD